MINVVDIYECRVWEICEVERFVGESAKSESGEIQEWKKWRNRRNEKLVNRKEAEGVEKLYFSLLVCL